uniref:PH domain-containing protein n=1 Tax=Mucochytrium quahogii TaxID=96639 RepID=A0A7S2W9Z7_9STRA|mmetsp:Transcript_20020/g.33031  ORF Transcript_20020/g.33031 Transcript_20020/m.33031 type:complete len:516 (+) Transcript_20020:129-1676(+)|eukprot:CAMPEP_0203745398 /NCGR_PEP_ID=MMETSP0098-20131031/1149_1 /ASSEMBLY_ACC=CAM_ASM_000208 /TAXON_ID=96639 /ORGANISM=" , Strain NY0313808BC1" /LENGTH=515 /DNA_ID=CAMNT_0050633167 /DNA_START=180 /DNA_END=1727 /DNA_ORIENTATION=-
MALLLVEQRGDKKTLGVLNYKVCTFALIVSSILLTGLKLAFKEPSRKVTRRSTGKKKGKRSSLGSAHSEETTLRLLENGSWTMEEICGMLQKQGDVFGMWKNRYFRLACLDSKELQEFSGLHKSYRFGDKTHAYILFYWACDAHVAISGQHRYNPRGAFDLSGCTITRDSQELFVLNNLVNAMDPAAHVPPVRLRASNERVAHRWISASSFASFSTSLPQQTTENGIRPLAQISDTLGFVLDSSGKKQEMYFKLYTAEGRRFLLCWEDEKHATSRPITAQNIYELSKSSSAIKGEDPQLIHLSRVENFMPANYLQVKGTLILKARTIPMAVEWAKLLCEDSEIDAQVEGWLAPSPTTPTKRHDDPPSMVSTPSSGVVGETVVDELNFSPRKFAGNAETLVDELSTNDILSLSKRTDDSDTDEEYDYNDEDDENDPYMANEEEEYHEDFASCFAKDLQNDLNRLEPWQSPRPPRLSPVVEEDQESTVSRRSSISSIASGLKVNLENTLQATRLWDK